MSDAGVHDVDAVAALCARSLADPPSADELARTVFEPQQPATLVGDPEVGVIATVPGLGAGASQGFVRLLVVAPEHRGRGVGRDLLTAGEDDLRSRGCTSVTIGEDAPYYLWPGVETHETALLYLLERRKYTRTGANYNMDVDLAGIPADGGGWVAAGPADRTEVEAWAEQHWGWWTAEMVRATERGTLVVSRDDSGITAVCAYDVTRNGWVGPVAVRPDLMGRGVGIPALVGALHRMRAAGYSQIEIGWVGPLVPYARVGATVGRVFFTYRKELA